MTDYAPDEAPSGFVCPACGGALWEHRRAGEARPKEQAGGEPFFECRIGHRFAAARLWIEHCAARNRALACAARSLAENAALARRLAAWTREQGNDEAAARLEEEAADEDRLYEQVRATLDGLPRLAARDPE